MKQYIRMPAPCIYFEFFLYFVSFIFSEPGQPIHIVVTSAKDVKLTPVRDAFTQVFGRVITQGIVSRLMISSVNRYFETHSCC